MNEVIVVEKVLDGKKLTKRIFSSNLAEWEKDGWALPGKTADAKNKKRRR